MFDIFRRPHKDVHWEWRVTRNGSDFPRFHEAFLAGFQVHNDEKIKITVPSRPSLRPRSECHHLLRVHSFDDLPDNLYDILLVNHESSVTESLLQWRVLYSPASKSVQGWWE